MKHSILLFLFLTFMGYSYSQTTVSGYYVTKTNDTLSAQLKMPKSIFGSVDFSKFLFKVEVSDSNSETKKFKPEDIKCFWFLYHGENYSFFSKPTITQNNLRFLQPVLLGQKTSLYEFQTVNQNGIPIGTFYTFEKADGTYTFLNTGIRSLDQFKETLKEFYKDNLELQKLIDSKFQTRTSLKNDILEIVQTANKS
nr:hypothetical protein [uncultured Flavobacterium sp.]